MKYTLILLVLLVGCKPKIEKSKEFTQPEIVNCDAIKDKHKKKVKELVRKYEKALKWNKKKYTKLIRMYNNCKSKPAETKIKYKYVSYGSNNKHSKQIKILNNNIDSLNQVVNSLENKNNKLDSDNRELIKKNRIKPTEKIKEIHRGLSWWWLILAFISGYLVKRYTKKLF